MELAGKKRGKLTAACGLAVLASAIRLVPYIMIFEVLKQLVFYYTKEAEFSQEKLTIYMAICFGSAILYGMSSYFSSIIAHNAAFDILYELRMAMMKKMGRISAGFYNSATQGGLKKLLVEDVEQIETFVAHNLCDVVAAIATPLFTLLVLFIVNWKLALVTFIPIIISILLLMAALMKPNGAKLQREMAERKTTMEGTVVEYIHGMSVIKIFGRTADSFKRFSGDLGAFTDKVKETAYYNANGMGLYYAFFGAQLLFLLPTSLIMFKNSPSYVEAVPTVLFFLLIGSGLKEPLENMMTVSVDSQKINACIERIDALLAEDETILNGSGKLLTTFDIDFENVSFSYTGDKDEASEKSAGVKDKASKKTGLGGMKDKADGKLPASKDIDDVTFHLPAGSCTALVGPSGGGKSTIAKLLLHFYEVESGRISIGGTDIREVTWGQLMSKVAYVFQDSYVFTDTIENNIRMGNATASLQDVKAAAAAASIDETIEALPNGYQTVVGSEMGGLSGGEKQRIAIARAILKDAPIVVLDEATAYADAENETKIQEAFRNLSRGKTVIMIAHRLKSIQNADKIIVMENGRVVGSGKHEELYETCPLYREMVDTNDRTLGWSMNSRAIFSEG
ncbi:MAG: ABC transporter ATP-binding protein/permease [Eubacterium sp.]|nr:ABC transporter ATP-binding protein/permease [Eubacterium sp.]